MKIRPYKQTDKERLRYICKETAWDSYKTDPNKLESVPIMYNDYFTENEPEYVFVLCDDNDVAVGYIICSADYEKFRTLMSSEYRKRVEKCAPEETAFLDGFLDCLEKIKDKPVHFHIDMLPSAQRQGWGRKLMEALWAKLKENGFDNLSGCCISRNSDGYKMYTKLGFTEFYDYGGDVVAINKKL